MTRLATLSLASLLFLGLAAPAVAKHENGDRKDRRAKAERYLHDRHDHDRYDRDWRRGRHDRHVPARLRCGNDLREAAFRLERQTARLLKRAVRHNEHPSRGERRALRRLYVLHREARDLRIATERHHRLRPIVREFRDVERAFDDARSRFARLDPDRKSRRVMRNAAHTLERIEDRFEPVLAHRGHGPWGRELAGRWGRQVARW